MKFNSFLLLLFVHLVAKAQSPTVVYPQRYSKAKVLSEVVMFYGYTEEGNRKDAGFKESYRKFNPQGYVTQHILYDEKQNGIKSNDLFRFDNKDNLISSISKDGKDNTLNSRSYTYNAKGKKHSIVGSEESSDYTIKFVYDTKDRLIQKVKLANGDTAFNLSYSYKNDQLSEETYQRKSTIIKTTYKYTTSDQPASKEIFKNDQLRQRIEFTYDSTSHKLIEETQFNDFYEPVYTYTYSYDDDGFLTSISLFDHILKYEKQKWRYYYNEQNLVDRVVTYESGGKIPVYEKQHIYKYAKKK